MKLPFRSVAEPCWVPRIKIFTPIKGSFVSISTTDPDIIPIPPEFPEALECNRVTIEMRIIVKEVFIIRFWFRRSNSNKPI
jgi:hypothetical protein